uniref:Tubulinspecific chaperone D putative n=1 Tax=Albugo laibachii Nc14 TaxID=890382 RepID=F0X0H1_9STRA|nr:tubulinspecific chaperone D putative [Albugo laibachii Nc14]|eukprot:CCA27261.1 tubulinspecific chaperone D putative [Albugo laibachii Nc14]
MLCLVPFDLHIIDSSLMDTTEECSIDTLANDKGQQSLVVKLQTLCKGYLADPGVTKVAAALCLARLLSRPDTEQVHLVDFLTWANAELLRAADVLGTSSDGAQLNESSSATIDQFKIIGIMQCLTYLAKFAPRDKHIQVIPVYFGTVLRFISNLTKITESSDASKRTGGSTLQLKLSIKLIQRLGLLFLPPKVMSWRYQRGLRSLDIRLDSIRCKQKEDLPSTPESNDTQMEDLDDDIIEWLEQIIHILLCGLRDRDTITRWSSAKGIGRITSRLPYIYADDIVISVLELFNPSESDGAWHGGSLALAELARRGLLLPQRLPQAVECTEKALLYDVRRGAHSIGAHVRDAACYTCWCFARAYEPALFLPYIKEILAPVMLINCVFDREVNCRRAASASFQECIGRQGHANFPKGIDILTRADYFAVSNIRHAYCSVSYFIAESPAYRYAFLDHLAKYKLSHWDVRIRTLSATAMGKITALDPAFALHHLLPRLSERSISPKEEVIIRHGSILAIAEMTYCLTQIPSFIDGELEKTIKQIVILVEERRLFRDRGGEMIRAALCNLIEAMATAQFNLDFVQMKQYLSILEECITHPSSSVATNAIAAYRTLARNCVSPIIEMGQSEHIEFFQRLIPRFRDDGVLHRLNDTEKDTSANGMKTKLSPNVAKRRGYIRAIGASPRNLLQPIVSSCIQVLVHAADLSVQSDEELDADSRVAAVMAMVEICCRKGVYQLDISASDQANIFEALINCVENDYAVDERGDVGSWVRIAAMQGLKNLLLSTDTYDALGSGSLIGSFVDVKNLGRGKVLRVVAIPPNEDDLPSNGPSMHSAVYHIQFFPPQLGFYYFPPNGVGLIRNEDVQLSTFDPTSSMATPLQNKSEQTLNAYPEGAKNDVTASNFLAKQGTIAVSFKLAHKIINAIAKQFAEKLDGVRAVAGTTLFTMLHASDSRVNGIPDRLLLQDEIFANNLSINWAKAHDTFPLVVRMMDSPSYLESVASGLIISVGGLTDNVVKAARSALFEWIERHVKAKEYEIINRFCYHLLSLFQKHRCEDRVIVALLKTIAIILASSIAHAALFPNHSETISQVTSAQQACVDQAFTFGDRLHRAIQETLRKTSWHAKILAGINVLLGLLPSERPVEVKAMHSLVTFLGHRYPKIRQYTAEQFYAKVLIQSDILKVDKAKCERMMELLSEVRWDLQIAAVRKGRLEVYHLLGLSNINTGKIP